MNTVFEISRELRYLEGESAIRERIQILGGRKPSAQQSAYAASCIMHGRLYWDAASAAPMETRPLLLYYGAASLAKALIMGKSLCQISEIAKGHGASCSAGDQDTVGAFVARTKGHGLFQQFNDVVAELNRLKYFKSTNSNFHYTSSAKSHELGDLRVSLVEILARVPSIADIYSLCTGENPRLLPLQFDSAFREGLPNAIRVDLTESFDGLDGLITHVAKIRSRAPFLSNWRVARATHAWNNSIVIFHDRPGAGEALEFSDLAMLPDGDFELHDLNSFEQTKSDPFAELPPLAGGYSGTVALVEGFDGRYVSEYSLIFLGLLALSSLVRYQPHIWTSCVHRRPFAGRQVDDKLLPAIEAFLGHAADAFPKLLTDIFLKQ